MQAIDLAVSVNEEGPRSGLKVSTTQTDPKDTSTITMCSVIQLVTNASWTHQQADGLEVYVTGQACKLWHLNGGVQLMLWGALKAGGLLWR